MSREFESANIHSASSPSRISLGVLRLSELLLVALLGGGLLATSAAAQLTFVDATGTAVAAPALVDPTEDAVYFEETLTAGGAIYDVTNNTPSHRLMAVGISNAGTTADFGLGSTFTCDSAGPDFFCYEALNLDAIDWGLVAIGYIFVPTFQEVTGQDVFGAFSNVTDPGEDTINFYRAADGDIGPDNGWDGWGFSSSTPMDSGQMFVILSDNNTGDTIYGSGGLPVPEPGFAALIGTGALGLGLSARRRRRNR